MAAISGLSLPIASNADIRALAWAVDVSETPRLTEPPAAGAGMTDFLVIVPSVTVTRRKLL